MRSIMRPQIVDTLIKQCEAGIERHKMNVRVLLEKRVGLAEHGDLMVTIEEELDKLAHFEDRLSVLNKYFLEDNESHASDLNLKENIRTIPNALRKVGALRGITFNWKKDGTKGAGLIAQDVQEVLPTAVTVKETPKGLEKNKQYKVIEHYQLFGLFAEAIKESWDKSANRDLQNLKRIEELEKKIKELEDK